MDDFNLEKYREENPMDYFKAIELISADPYNSEIMNVIYRVTRLHIPDLVYKYYSLTDDTELNNIKFNTLVDKKIFLADASMLNDPFEGKAFLYDHKKLAYFATLSKWDGKLIDDFTSYVRLTSLTSAGTNCMPMWAHYANNHSGFCIEYDTKLDTNLSLVSSLFSVQYTDKRVDITELIESLMIEIEQAKVEAVQKNAKKVQIKNLTVLWASIYYCCLKHQSWSYEKELRIVTSSIHRYIKAIPSAIYVGVKCSDENKISLSSISRALKIPLYQMCFDEYALEYRLKAERII